jgi:putative acetyltransferase
MMVSVRVETARQDNVAALLRQSDDVAALLYPGEYRRKLDPDALVGPGIHVLVAREGSVAVGCCALIDRGDGTAELKRMIVDAPARHQGVGTALMRAVETEAAKLGVGLIRMEVGIRNTDGQALYRRAGFTERGPFTPHKVSPISLFFEKVLGDPAEAAGE